MHGYDPKTKCPKCDYDSLRTEYHAPSYEEEEGCAIVLCAYPDRREHMVRFCGRCGYEFYQKPIRPEDRLEVSA